MRLSFAISMSSTGAVSGRVLSRPTAQPGKPPFGIRVEAHDNDSDVVRASALVRQSDEFFRRPRGIGLRLESPGDFRLGDEGVIPRQLQQGAAAEQIGAAIADVNNAEPRIIDPGSRQSGAHAALLGMFLGRLEDVFVGQMKSTREALRSGGPTRLRLT